MSELLPTGDRTSSENLSAATGNGQPRPAATPSGSTCDPAEIKRWLALAFRPDQTFEIRACKRPNGAFSKTCRGKSLAVAAAFAQIHSGRMDGVYYTINPVRADLKGAACDNDVMVRVRFFIDCDPTRQAETSATEAEKAAALGKAATIRVFLRARGWPEGALVDSGNGYHLVYAIDLSANDEGLVKAVLKSLAARFDTPDCKVDTVVSNPSRICKLPGTLACKGENTADRPHRLSRVIDAPDELVVVSAELLQTLVDELTPPAAAAFDLTTEIERKRTEAEANGTAKPKRPMPDAETRAIAYLAKCDPAISGQRGHNAAFKAACKIGPGFDLPPDTAFRLLWDHYNPRCEPPWSEKELRHKVADAYEKETRRGWLLTAERDGGPSRKGTATPASTTPGPVPNTNGHPAAGEGPGTAPAPSGNGNGKPHEPLTDAQLGLTDMDTVQARPVDWLWRNRIPEGKITLIAGEKGVGKSFLTLEIASIVSRGAVWPDLPTEPVKAGHVILVGAEDDLEDTVKPRLDAMGANTKRITSVGIGKNPNGTATYFCVADIPRLEAIMAARPETRVIIIDPITSYLGAIDDHKNAQLRAVLMPLVEFAKKYHVAIIIITHFNKGEGRKVMSRIIGSVAYTATARAVWCVALDPEDENRRLFMPVAANLATEKSSLAYTIVDGAVAWEPMTLTLNANDVVGREGAPKKERRKLVIAWLKETLAAGAMPSEDVIAKASAAGFGKNLVWEVKEEAGVIAKRSGFGSDGEWAWQLATPTTPY